MKLVLVFVRVFCFNSYVVLNVIVCGQPVITEHQEEQSKQHVDVDCVATVA